MKKSLLKKVAYLGIAVGFVFLILGKEFPGYGSILFSSVVLLVQNYSSSSKDVNPGIKQTQSSGDNSTNLQVGGNLEIRN
ncbi:MAG: hypothetical protein AAFY71_18415 [Bacteroidota bacterium]